MREARSAFAAVIASVGFLVGAPIDTLATGGTPDHLLPPVDRPGGHRRFRRARQPTGQASVDVACVISQAYLAADGVTGTVTITGPATVQITVTVDRPAVMELFSPTYHATATQTAAPAVGTCAGATP
ncbi:hypothetical protein [Kutzneria sp. 744]|uniref:hypothetical protein n=1 Tax=Kutzneria sp. (strain 744) TaxID=345341 RepID=UPI0003EEDE50|nr:hypothetical protein [Kutzneria sp. 744]EWM15280.1 hypothetical protein KUTG_05584 [Kutzneria sp. 744]